MSRLLERRRENWRGVRIGPWGMVGLGWWEGKIVMCRGLFCALFSGCKRLPRLEGRAEGTFLPITPRQAIDGTAILDYK